MCNYMRTIILIFIILLITSCSDNADLGNSYYYLDSFEAKDVGYPYGAIVYKSPTKNLYKNTIISREVVHVKHNDKFILAKQTVEDKVDTNYYIIDKINDKLFGPLTLDSFTVLSNTLQTEL